MEWRVGDDHQSDKGPVASRGGLSEAWIKPEGPREESEAEKRGELKGERRKRTLCRRQPFAPVTFVLRLSPPSPVRSAHSLGFESQRGAPPRSRETGGTTGPTAGRRSPSPLLPIAPRKDALLLTRVSPFQNERLQKISASKEPVGQAGLRWVSGGFSGFSAETDCLDGPAIPEVLELTPVTLGVYQRRGSREGGGRRSFKFQMGSAKPSDPHQSGSLDALSEAFCRDATARSVIRRVSSPRFFPSAPVWGPLEVPLQLGC
ncbi:hypothetical protein AAFF_G00424730 [Aldrovandia affinis]|uniref:Uncharacterized protein n=1 Tax=Aldrovandia affinis TaxID=143900 RepID=A0AAD7T777_9TELE|nr:hypothetical protein AAFF_G00424730 [Aldrovandia affinis]